MPLKEGRSNKVVADNIRTLRHEGVSQKEAVARALAKAGRGRRRKQ